MKVLVLSCENQGEVEALTIAIESCCYEHGWIVADKPYLGVQIACNTHYNMGYCFAEVEIATRSCNIMSVIERAIAHLV